MELGTNDGPEFTYPENDDLYMFSYTSGTTGDPKGVKITHNKMMRTAICGFNESILVEGDSVISYMPYPHVFE